MLNRLARGGKVAQNPPPTAGLPGINAKVISVIYTVCLLTQKDGNVSAVAPDLPDTLAEDSDHQRALTKVHLRMEKAVADLLLDNRPVPPPRSPSEIAGLPEYAGHEVVTIDINPVHLAAVARHQGRR